MAVQLKAFAPIVDDAAKILILGSMPGAQSLHAGEYYANKQNAFWRILKETYPNHASTLYAEKIAMLKFHGIALWDVLSACERQGSLDQHIIANTMQLNDFAQFYRQYPNIRRVLFNGMFAEKSYTSHALKTLNPSLTYTRLPSTSPAHATLNFDAKLAIWKKAIAPHDETIDK